MSGGGSGSTGAGGRETGARPTRLALLVVGALFLLLPFASTVSAATAWNPTPRSWSNGTVLCEFAPTVPTVSVSAVTRVGTGLTASILSLTEVSPAGAGVASANLSASTWSGANDSTSGAFDLAYTVSANATSFGSPAHVLGTVDLRVDYILPTYDGPDAAPVNAVSVQVHLSGWPWQSPADHLVMTLAAEPTFAGEERIVLGSTGSPLLTSVATSSGSPFEEMTGATEASATGVSGIPTTVSATPSVAGNATGATVSIAFGASAGEFSALNYSAGVTVLFPATVAGIPTIDLVAVGGAAGLISACVAVGVRRARGHPSDLTFVDSEKP